MATITVGYDRRCWATFTVKDATEAELELLGSERGEEVAILLREMDYAGRLEYEGEDQEDAPEYFASYAHPCVTSADRG